MRTDHRSRAGAPTSESCLAIWRRIGSGRRHDSNATRTFGGRFGGPFKIPGLYANEHRRTNFQINYTGSRSNSVFDQYATVPTDAERNGDFSGLPIQLTDPTTGQPFAGNQIPKSSMNSNAAILMPFIPAPNLAGTIQNYHVSTIAPTSSEAISFRMTQNLSPTVAPPNGPGGFGGAFGGGGRGGGFGGPFGTTGTNMLLSAQLQYGATKHRRSAFFRISAATRRARA